MLNLKDPSLLKTQNFIDGQWADGGAGTIDVTNPANGAVVATVATGDTADAIRAVEAAAEAFKSWSNIPDLQAACRRCWLYYTLEFPKRYDRAQSRTCPWIGLHHCY